MWNERTIVKEETIERFMGDFIDKANHAIEIVTEHQNYLKIEEEKRNASNKFVFLAIIIVLSNISSVGVIFKSMTIYLYEWRGFPGVICSSYSFINLILSMRFDLI